jgi:hypothetical protein
MHEIDRRVDELIAPVARILALTGNLKTAASIGRKGGGAQREMAWHPCAILIDDGAKAGSTIAARIRRLRVQWKPE